MKLVSRKFDAIIFDLDGTLWDASYTSARAWSLVAQRLELQTPPIDHFAIRNVTGLPFTECVRSLFGQASCNTSELADLLEIAEKEEVVKFGGEMYPEVIKGVPKLHKQYKLFLVSNCQEWYLHAFFEHTGLKKYFDDTLCHGQTGLPKSENLKQIVLRHQLAHPVYIGDTQWDEEASRLAKMAFIYANYGFGKISAPCPSVQSFSELLNVFLEHGN